MTITPAQRRVLTKARDNGFVMAQRGFCDTDSSVNPIDDPIFDRRSHIDKLINAGALTWGGGANQYVLTGAGQAALQSKRGAV